MNFINDTNLKGVKKILPPTIFEDYRGTYVEIYNEKIYKDNGITQNFIQDDISTSRKNVLRGIHGDDCTWKLISCLSGAFYLVVVNNDKDSDQYKKYESFTLSESNRVQILIPPKFGNGHLVLTESAIFHYKQSTDYARDKQFTIRWNDPNYNIRWPIENPILSFRDS